jgi:hypothetical protein
MNERIRELAEQAGYDIKPFYKGEDDYQIPHYKDEKLEKFAELIIQECAEIVNNHFESLEPGYPGDKIEEHFGVKE